MPAPPSRGKTKPRPPPPSEKEASLSCCHDAPHPGKEACKRRAKDRPQKRQVASACKPARPALAAPQDQLEERSCDAWRGSDDALAARPPEACPNRQECGRRHTAATSQAQAGLPGAEAIGCASRGRKIRPI